ncbi:hypothetical protein [Pseudovibrio exalbescens]|uniref:hypothetical protein n=1 Tax=Pseudovibrio exalbescens TaxID=197461 RepID=UPI000C9A5BCB|nr:hypothetical protein [Pseudovibrio exalbescens]
MNSPHTYPNRARRVLLCAAPLAVLALPAMAHPTADAFIALLEERGATIVSQGQVVADDHQVLLNDVEATLNGRADHVLKFGRIALSDAEVGSDGGLSASAVAIENFMQGQPDLDFHAERILLTNLHVPTQSPMMRTGTRELFEFETAAVQNALFQDYTSGATVPVSQIAIELTPASPKTSMGEQAQVSVSGVQVDFTALSDRQRAALDKLGIDELELSGTINGRWQQTTGTLDIEPLTVTANKYATLRLSTTIEGLDEDILAQFQRLAQQEQTLALDLFQGVNLVDLTLALENEGDLETLLDAEAEARGQTRTKMAQHTTETLEHYLAPFQAPEFKEQLLAATATFLQEPKSFQLKLAPAAPVTFEQVFGTIMLSPSSLPYLLGASIHANSQ